MNIFRKIFGILRAYFSLSCYHFKVLRIQYIGLTEGREEGKEDTFFILIFSLILLWLLDDSNIKNGEEAREETEGKSGKVHRGRKKIKRKYKERVERKKDGSRLGVELNLKVRLI